MTFHQARPGALFRAAVARDTLSRQRLGDVLVEAGVITRAQLDEALDRQEVGLRSRPRLGIVLVELGLADETEIARALGTQLRLPTVDLAQDPPPVDVVRLLPRAVAKRSLTLVSRRTQDGLVVAMADPTDVLALDDVALHTRERRLTVAVATPQQILERLSIAWRHDLDHIAAAAQAQTSAARRAPSPGGPVRGPAQPPWRPMR